MHKVPADSNTYRRITRRVNILGSSLSDAKGATLPEILYQLKLSLHQGVLMITGEGVRTRIFFQAGQPVFADGGCAEHTLPHVLMHRGIITGAQFAAVMELSIEIARTASQSSGEGEEQDRVFGECLVKLGILSSADVFAALRLVSRERIYACFSYPVFEHEVIAGAEAPRSPVEFEGLTVEQLILVGIRRYFNSDRIEKILAHQFNHYPTVLGGPSLSAALGLSSNERRFLLSVDGRKTVKAVCLESRELDSFAALELFAALSCVRALEVHATPQRKAPVKARAFPAPAYNRVIGRLANAA